MGRSYCSSRLLSVFFFLLAPAAVAQPPFRRRFCSDDDYYTPNSTYQTNLNRLLSSLRFIPSIDGFAQASAGESSDKVYMAVLCQGDLSPAACWSCVNDSISKLTEVCPLQRRAIGWYDKCMLRFSNNAFFGLPEVDPWFVMTSPFNFSSSINKSDYNRALGSLMYRLRVRAVAGDSRRKFATEEIDITGYQRIYGMVQCLPNLSEESCSQCLEIAIARIADCCDGKEGARIVFPSCYIRYEPYRFYGFRDAAETPQQAPFPLISGFSPLPSAGISTPNNISGNHITNKARALTIVHVIASTISVVVLIIICFLLRRKAFKELVTENGDSIRSTKSLQYRFGTIEAATGHFSLANKLGQGGFGSVFKGRLPDGQEIAVKRLSIDSGQGDPEFENEVIVMAKLQHKNLVKLLGFCLHGNERLLIYEFVPNASLDKSLFDPVTRSHLDWDRRHKIIEGIARGLLYLHEDSRLRIIHRDLKASNILLDANMNPKISDFGIARLFNVDETQGHTSRVVGTYGYMAPEYALHGQFSFKTDVYSFGVLVLELVSGQKNNCFHNGEDFENLVTCAWKKWREGTTLSIVDPTLINGSRMNIMRCIHIALLCVQENVADRPTVASLLLMLNNDSFKLAAPAQPPFFMDSAVHPNMRPFQVNSSVNDFDLLQESTSFSTELSVAKMSISIGKAFFPTKF